MRRFWARQPRLDAAAAAARAALPVPRALAGRAAGDGARSSSAATSSAGASPGFAHETRWQHDGRAAAAVLARACARRDRATTSSRDAARDAARRASRAGRRSRRTSTSRCARCSSGYLLSSQGDRMLMAHSVEGRFPVPRPRRRRARRTRCRRRTSCACSTRSTCSSARRAGLVPDGDPARARSSPTARPTRSSFVGAGRAGLDRRRGRASARSREAGVFDPRRPRQLAGASAGPRRRRGQFSNADNMALVGVLSTQLLYDQFVRRRPAGGAAPRLTTDIDRMSAGSPAVVS